MAEFNISLRDSQSSIVSPIAPEKFDIEAYCDYEASLLPGNKNFADSNSGIQVYRRFRADGVFFDKCRDYKESLELQLGALKASMAYKADIANFLEPWYGIGYIASSFGVDYIWLPNQAPNVEAKFKSCKEILSFDPIAIKDTGIGKSMLEMIEYFLEKTKGRLPISFSDIQSPMNMLSYLMPVTELFMEFFSDPEGLHEVTEMLTDLLIDFLKEQRKLIGDALASPGHGFASSKAFKGVGASDDMSIMISADDYKEFFMSADERLGDEFGGFVYHSCGVWESKIEMVKSFRNIISADAAFSAETDPDPNDPEKFRDAFSGSGICLNARAVGNVTDAFEAFEKLWTPDQKLIAVTYCSSPEEQEELYNKLHAMKAG